MAAPLLLLGAIARADEGDRRTWTFEDEAAGSAPRGFTPAVGAWAVVATDEDKALAQSGSNANPVFNVALIDDTRARDVDFSVRIRALAGELDQGGGLVWRARDAKNSYVARYNHPEDNFRVYRVVDGARPPPLPNADVKHHDGWTVVRVTMRGDRIVCYLDAKKSLEVRDSILPEAGKIGCGRSRTRARYSTT